MAAKPPYRAGRGFNTGPGSYTDQSLNVQGNTFLTFSNTINQGGGGGGGKQKKVKGGQYGFQRYWQGRSELGGIGFGYDWRDMGRPAVHAGSGPLKAPLGGRGASAARWTYGKARGRGRGGPGEPMELGEPEEAGPTGPVTSPTILMGEPDPLGGTTTVMPRQPGEMSMDEWMAPGYVKRIGGAAAREGAKWVGGKIVGAWDKRQGAKAPGTQFPPSGGPPNPYRNKPDDLPF